MTKDTKKIKNKVLGVSMPLQLYSYITLFGYKCKLSNGEILRMATKNWFRLQKQTHSMDYLIKEIKKEVQEKWYTRKMKKMNCISDDFIAFKKEILNDLLKRGIRDEIAEQIIDFIKY